MESSKIGFEKFDGFKISLWKMQIEDYMYKKYLHEFLSGVKPNTMTTEQWKLKDRQTLWLIRLTLSKNVVFNIIKEKTTSDLLKALSNTYEKPSTMNKVYLMWTLFNLSQLSSVKIIFEDEIKALILHLYPSCRILLLTRSTVLEDSRN